ncbi:MAG: hypothetical protein VXZ88_07085, partial [Verrucomicrobiota bacterium]|nr:hypothetical protein [Verrucomicrobiota bacterium]
MGRHLGIDVWSILLVSKIETESIQESWLSRVYVSRNGHVRHGSVGTGICRHSPKIHKNKT